ncbi:hypothetical protein [Acinetobacter pittii]|uniref:hypothetical protein n=1 Tax=Acinetobacter pittii TaxID=48296 RepID=UPI00083D4FCB|nr:hypothetical protein [Acinetobacter pittii]MCK0911587.1 hypothetical protein [Acinetobacter pittii]
MTGNIVCISTFEEVMNHEFPHHTSISVPKQGYKVDGKGIKDHCKLNKLKSVDYYHFDSKRGFFFIEFSDLLRQDIDIKTAIERITNSNLIPRDKKTLRKYYYKLMNKELVSKYNDSFIIKTMMVNYINNIPSFFEQNSSYCIVVTPIDHLETHEQIEIAKFLTTLEAKIMNSLPTGLFTDVKVIPLNRFCKS